MSGHHRLLPALLVALVTTTGCALTADHAGSIDPTGGGDARPSVGTLPDATPTDPTPPSHPAARTVPPGVLPVDRSADYGTWVPLALDRLDERTAGEPTEARDGICQLVTPDDCRQLPDELPAAAIRMFRWVEEHDELVAPNEILRAAAVACLLLDEMSWGEMILLLADAADRTEDIPALLYSAVAALSPVAVVFLCPEHEAGTKAQMVEVACDRYEPEVCDQFVDRWPSA